MQRVQAKFWFLSLLAVLSVGAPAATSIQWIGDAHGGVLGIETETLTLRARSVTVMRLFRLGTDGDRIPVAQWAADKAGGLVTTMDAWGNLLITGWFHGTLQADGASVHAARGTFWCALDAEDRLSPVYAVAQGELGLPLSAAPAPGGGFFILARHPDGYLMRGVLGENGAPLDAFVFGSTDLVPPSVIQPEDETEDSPAVIQPEDETEDAFLVIQPEDETEDAPAVIQPEDETEDAASVIQPEDETEDPGL